MVALPLIPYLSRKGPVWYSFPYHSFKQIRLYRFGFLVGDRIASKSLGMNDGAVDNDLIFYLFCLLGHEDL